MPDDPESLFRTLDDGEWFEQPPGFDREGARRRVQAFAADLDARLGRPSSLETGSAIQDASFHSQIELPGGRLRFSSFGDMIALTPDHEVPEDLAGVIRELATLHGYRLIPTEELEQPYTGRNCGVTGIFTWWIRFFDWA